MGVRKEKRDIDLDDQILIAHFHISRTDITTQRKT
jgi:hypothetical protein